MAKLNLKYYDGKNIYNDGDVEEKLLEHYKSGKPIDHTKEDIFYLVTDVRKNILNWYPFTKQDKVLEIGCGCGTLTGSLCEKCQNVVCVEGSKRRAEITYYRHQNKDNLEVYAGNFNDIKIDQKFDYIILIGVFEYAKLFFKSNEPFDEFLEKIKKLLKPNGKVLIAIENRYGIKYWAGANEDHIVKPYVGLEGYEAYKVQTFGQKELINLITKHGFTKTKFYYPFPDYKLPTIVYTDKRLPKENEISSIPIYPYGGKINFDVLKTISGLIENEAFGFFSNSFLIEFGFDSSTLSDIIYARNLDYRNLDFKTITIEDEKHNIYKIPDNPKAKLHLDKLVEIHKKVKAMNIKICDIEEQNGKYLIEWIEGKNVAEYIIELSKRNQWDLVEEEIDNLVSFYYSISVKKKITNPIIDEVKTNYKNETYVMKLALMDGNASNIIKNKKGEYVFIDQEWEIDKELPTEYLIYYSLAYVFGTNSLISKYLSIERIYKKYGITKNKRTLFNQIEKYYFTKYQRVIDTDKKHILDGCRNSQSDEEELLTVIYYDDGNDFCEKNKLINKYKNGKTTGEYIVDFTLPKKVLRVRFDPIITGNKLMYFSDIKINGRRIDYDEYNINWFNHKKMLTSEHPFIVFPYNKEKLTISIKLEKLSASDQKQFFQEKETLEQENKKLKENNRKLSKEKENLDKELKELLNSKGWKIIEKIRKLKK